MSGQRLLELASTNSSSTSTNPFTGLPEAPPQPLRWPLVGFAPFESFQHAAPTDLAEAAGGDESKRQASQESQMSLQNPGSTIGCRPSSRQSFGLPSSSRSSADSLSLQALSSSMAQLVSASAPSATTAVAAVDAVATKVAAEAVAASPSPDVVPPSPPPLAPKRQCRSLTLLRGELLRPVPVRPQPPQPLLDAGLRDLHISEPPPPPQPLLPVLPLPPPPPSPPGLQVGSPPDSLSPRSFPNSPDDDEEGVALQFVPLPPRLLQSPPQPPPQPPPQHQLHFHLPPPHHNMLFRRAGAGGGPLGGRWHRRRRPPLPGLPTSAGRRFLVGLPRIANSPSPRHLQEPSPMESIVDVDEGAALAAPPPDVEQLPDEEEIDDEFFLFDDGTKDEDLDSGCEDVRGVVELDVDEIESDL